MQDPGCSDRRVGFGVGDVAGKSGDHPGAHKGLSLLYASAEASCL